MINVLTMYFKVQSIQEQVMSALYTRNSYEDAEHKVLLKYTGQNIMEHKEYINDVCRSSFIRGCFNIIKKIGGCPDLTIEDFDRFTNYVKDGGLDSMWFMLKSENQEEAFVDELDRLPKRVRDNAHAMLTKARALHEDFVTAYLYNKFPQSIPGILIQHFNDTNAFLARLVALAYHEQQLDEVLEAVEKAGVGV